MTFELQGDLRKNLRVFVCLFVFFIFVFYQNTQTSYDKPEWPFRYILKRALGPDELQWITKFTLYKITVEITEKYRKKAEKLTVFYFTSIFQENTLIFTSIYLSRPMIMKFKG